MKKLASLALALTMSLSLVACGQTNTDNTDATSPSISTSPSPETSVTVDYDSFLTTLEGNVMFPALMTVDQDMLSTLFSFEEGAVESFLVRTPMMAVSSMEYGIFKGDVSAIQAGIDKRLADLDASWNTYLPDQWQLVKDCTVYTQGDYVMYIICDEADKVYAENTFNRLFDDSIQALVRPVSFRIASGVVVDVTDTGLLLNLDVNGTIFTVNGLYSEATFIDMDHDTNETYIPQTGDAVSVSFLEELVVTEDSASLEGELAFVGRDLAVGLDDPSVGGGMDGGLAGDMGVGDMGVGDMGVGDMGVAVQPMN